MALSQFGSDKCMQGWARQLPVLAERAHQNEMDQPGQSLCSRKAAHQTNRTFS
jgi:hypothetical protein